MGSFAGRHFRRLFAIMSDVGKWCTVTVTDRAGRRYSLDLQAESSYDAAHIYMAHVQEEPRCGLPKPTLETIFEVATDQGVYRVEASKLRDWIERKRKDLNGPRSVLFRRRPRFE
jgi:hypothetical protein